MRQGQEKAGFLSPVGLSRSAFSPFLVLDVVLGTAGIIVSKTVLLLTGFLFSRGFGQTTANRPEWDPQGPV